MQFNSWSHNSHENLKLITLVTFLFPVILAAHHGVRLDNVNVFGVIHWISFSGFMRTEEGGSSYSVVKKWAAQFKGGSERLEDDPSPGWKADDLQFWTELKVELHVQLQPELCGFFLIHLINHPTNKL